MKTNRHIAFITLSTVPMVVHSLTPYAFAADVTIGILPQVVDVEVTPGDIVTERFTVKNQGSESISLRPLFQPFTASSRENGEVQYENTTPALFKNVTVFFERQKIDLLELKPGEEKQIEVVIDTTNQTLGNDIYFSLILMSEPKSNQTILDRNNASANDSITGYTTVSGGVAAHILVTRKSTPYQKLSIKEFSTPLFSQNDQVAFHARVSNENQHYSRVHGQIAVKNILGNTVKKVIIPETRILSQGTRVLKSDTEETTNDSVRIDSSTTNPTNEHNLSSAVIVDDLLPGIYQAELTLAQTGTQELQTNSIYFFVAPLQLLLTISIILVVGYLVKRRLKKRDA